MKKIQALKYIFFLTILFTAYSCGQYAGNNNYAGGGVGGTGVSMGKITAVGATSISVNGVEFSLDNGNTAITLNGSTGDITNLKPGMVVKVDGEFDASGLTAKAKSIEFDKDIEGPVDSIDTTTNTLVVLGKTIIVDGATFYENTTGLDKLAIGNIIEVSGLIDSDGIIHATYIEFKSESFKPGDTEIELKGTISNLDTMARTFDLNGTHISYTNDTTIEPAGKTLQDDLFVEVKSTTGLDSNGALSADKIEIKETTPGYTDGEKVEIEGFVTGFTSVYDFKINNQSVCITDSTQFENGKPSDIKLNIKLEVKGTISNGVLYAQEISIESENSQETEQNSSENKVIADNGNDSGIAISGTDNEVMDNKDKE